MTSAVEIRETLREYLCAQLPLATEDVLAADDSLVENGVIDSLGILGVVSFLEETSAIIDEDEEVGGENFEMLSVLTRFVESKRETSS